MFMRIQHINLSCSVRSNDVAVNKLALSRMSDFYHGVVGLPLDPVPAGRENDLIWFRIGDQGQQIHVTFEEPGYQSLSLSEVSESVFILQ